MAQSFDFDQLTIEKAANIVAVRAQLGCAKHRDKTAQTAGPASSNVGASVSPAPSPTSTTAAGGGSPFSLTSTPGMALMGAGLGLGGGLLATALSRRKRKRWLRNALLGSLLGGGLGAAGGYLANMENPFSTASGKLLGDLEKWQEFVRHGQDTGMNMITNESMRPH